MPYLKRELMDLVLLPYSQEEFALQCKDWEWNAIFASINAQNFMLINAAHNFTDFIAGNASKPTTPLSALLRPSRNPSANYSDTLLKQLYDLMLRTPYEELPCPESVYFASRSTVTLLDELEQISPTRYLLDAHAAIEHIFNLITHRIAAPTNVSTYHRELTDLFQSFIKSCTQNAKELTFQESDLLNAAIKQHKSATRKTPRPAHFSDLQREMVRSIWLEAQHNPFLLGSCNKTRLSHETAFNHYKTRLRIVGINTEDDFRRCLESERNRQNYLYKMGKRDLRHF